MSKHTFDANDETLDYTMTTGGIYTFDARRSTGDLTFTLQTSIDGGSNFINYYNKNGVLQQVACSSSRPHVRFEELGREGQIFRVISSGAASTPSYPAEAGRVVASF